MSTQNAAVVTGQMLSATATFGTVSLTSQGSNDVLLLRTCACSVQATFSSTDATALRHGHRYGHGQRLGRERLPTG